MRKKIIMIMIAAICVGGAAWLNYETYMIRMQVSQSLSWLPVVI